MYLICILYRCYIGYLAVPDHTVQHGGCSKHKRRETKEGSALASRVYRPSPEIVAITGVRCDELKAKAKALCGE